MCALVFNTAEAMFSPRRCTCSYISPTPQEISFVPLNKHVVARVLPLVQPSKNGLLLW